MTWTGVNRLALAAAIAASAVSAGAQSPTGVAPSGRGTSEVVLTGEGDATWRIRIDYGQPHRRGRVIADSLIPRNAVWRTGANATTTFTTEVDLMIGSTRVPRGAYSLFTLWDGTNAQLILNRDADVELVQYSPEQDFARIPLRVTQVSPPVESLNIWLIPARDDGPRGEFRLAWGTLQYSVDWRVAP